MVWKLTGMAGGIVAGWTLVNAGPTVLAFPAFAACLFLGAIVDELGRPWPARERAVALIEVRRLRDYLPLPATAVASALAAMIVGGLAIIVVAGILSDLPPTVGYAWLGPFSERHWPGRGMPAMVLSVLATTVVTVLGGLALLRSLVRAPRAGVDAQARERDEQWRRRVASTLVSCLGWTLSIPLAYFGFLLSSAMPAHGSAWVAVSLLVTALGAAGLFAAGWYGSKLIAVDG
jgi:hypothetical protein